MDSYYWHDYETWGVSPAVDRPVQFAGVRTDLDFNVVGEPLNILCRPALDTLPHPEACLVTGITPQQAEQQGLPERDFVAAVHAELARPGTCGVGYNSIRFDDEVTRYALYRNFYDPYAREWQSGNSRWDIIDMVRLCYALRPEGIEWPQRDDGVVSFKLELLTAANGLAHESAHDALSDVYATISLARFIKQLQPRLFEHIYALRNKRKVADALALASGKPVLHISSRFGAQLGCGSLVLPIAQHPVNKNEIICVDLRYSPEPLFDCDAGQLAELLYTPVEELPEGVGRIPLKSVHLNRCPIVLTPKLLDDAACERLQLDMNVCERHRQQLLSHPELANKLMAVFSVQRFDNSGRDAEELLYDGFFSNSDRQAMSTIPNMHCEVLREAVFAFEDSRLPELFQRYKARNFPQTLTEEERAEWLEFCRERCLGKKQLGEMVAADVGSPLEQRLERIAELSQNEALDTSSQAVLSDLVHYLESKRRQLEGVE